MKNRLHPDLGGLLSETGKVEIRRNVSAKTLLLNTGRFDLLAKFLYLEFKESGLETEWAKNLYLESIWAFNRYSESNREYAKEDESDFLNSFDALFASIKREGFRAELGLVPVTPGGVLIDGGHRVAACAYLGLSVDTITLPADTFFDYRFFRSRGLKRSAADAIAFKFCEICPDAYVACVFPSIEGRKTEEIEKILRERVSVYYGKTVGLENEGPVILTQRMYRREAWKGDWDDNFQGI